MKALRDHPAFARVLLLGALFAVALVARLPGVLWGENFPPGFRSHHPDEYSHLVNAKLLLNPEAFGSWKPHPYPKGLAAMVVVPILPIRTEVATRHLVLGGRLVSAVHGAATVVVLALLVGRLFRDPRMPPWAALLLALGGLHVTQSHFFVADAPALFWLMTGLLFLLRDLQRPAEGHGEDISWAALCMGVTFGLKLLPVGLPSLGLVALLRPPRATRVAKTAVFFFAGFVGVNFASYTPHQLWETLVRGVGDPYVYSRLTGMLLYAAELPSILGFPMTLFALAGALLLGRRLLDLGDPQRLREIGLVVGLPILVYAYFLVFTLDHFPRHVVLWIPWAAVAAAWALLRAADALSERGIHAALLLTPFLLYQLAFVADGERVFLQEPRNAAATWLEQHVGPDQTIWWRGTGRMPKQPGIPYTQVRYPAERPDFLIVDMKDANHYLSGMGPRDSYPEDTRNVFDSFGQEWLEAMQAVFRGEAGYGEVARFSEGYRMPEYALVDRWVGNRSRNYVAEIVVFRREDEESRAP